MLGVSQTRLFFTHFGANGILEAMWHGVPMLGIHQSPLDQDYNAAVVEAKGLGRSLGPFATADQIHSAIVEVMENSRLVQPRGFLLHWNIAFIFLLPVSGKTRNSTPDWCGEGGTRCSWPPTRPSSSCGRRPRGPRI